ncbi:MAG: molybdate ABC transporter substrate-binding protein [Proteobacteria bacterium]|nr:molybdate ABC transporter substrate-binding protein [Pseudomonadota bacterium]
MTFTKVIVAGLAVLSSMAAMADELKVAVAANFLKTIETLSQNFEKQTGNTIKVSGGPTGKLYAQIINGAPFDIFFSADQKATKKLEDDGQIKFGSRFIYAQGRLSLWMPGVPAGVDALDVLKKGEFKHIALANPKAAPYGVAAEQVLEKLGLLEALRPKFVMGENIGQTYQFVATGNAQLGFVAHSYTVDAKHVNKGSYWLVPLSYHDPLDQDVVILKKAENNKVAQEFIDYVRSAEGKKIIEASGYTVPN